MITKNELVGNQWSFEVLRSFVMISYIQKHFLINSVLIFIRPI